MEGSKLSYIISATRLLPHFSPTNINVMKTCMFDQLGIETEGQFLCIALNSLYKTLSTQSLSMIKTKAIEIAEKQSLHHTQSLTNTSICLDGKAGSQQHQQHSKVTVYKYIQNKYNDTLSRLHSDIIDYFGTFLNKKQSIEFGYLNRHLFIETQKQSYLLRRCKDKIFRLHSKRCSKLVAGKNDAFNYTSPRSLSLKLGFDQSNEVQNVPSFSSFFRRLSILKCNTFSSLCCVPLNNVFIKHRNYYPNKQSCDNMDLFRMSGDLGIVERIRKSKRKKIDLICKNFDQLMLKHSGDDKCKMRGIERFEFEPVRSTPEYMNSLSKSLFTRFGNISKSIVLFNTKLAIETISELTSIFHPDLRHIYFDYSSEVVINIENVKNSVGMFTSSLQSIEFDTRKRKNVANCIDTLNEFDKMGIRQSIKRYTLHWSTRHPFFSGSLRLEIDDDARNVFDKIFFQDCDKYPLLESIVIKFQDNIYLLGVIRLLLYFNQHYKQLFVERKLYLGHFQAIEVDIDNRWMSGDRLERYPDAAMNSEFFDQGRNKEYSIDDKRVEIKSHELKQGIDSFGIIYQNIFHWLSRRQDQSGTITFRIE